MYHNRPSFLEAAQRPEETRLSVVDPVEDQSICQPPPLSATIPPAATLLSASETHLETADLDQKVQDEICGDSNDGSGSKRHDDEVVRNKDEVQIDSENHEEAGIVFRKDSRQGKQPSIKPAVHEQAEEGDEGNECDDMNNDDDEDSDDDEGRDAPSKPAADLTLSKGQSKKSKKNKKAGNGGNGGKGGKGKKGKRRK